MLRQEKYDKLDPPEFKCPSMMSVFIVLEWSAKVCRDNREAVLAELAELRAEGLVLDGEWPQC